jgi:hypothetical protein
MVTWVYIVKCSDGSYYTGVAHDGLERRIDAHNAEVTAAIPPPAGPSGSSFPRTSTGSPTPSRRSAKSSDGAAPRRKRSSAAILTLCADSPSGVPKAATDAAARASWFETALARLLAMRGDVDIS